MKLLPSSFTVLRMVCAVCLLFCNVAGTMFWALYGVCGISDMLDGWLARKMHCVTRAGAMLDSVADICFVVCCCWQLLPVLVLPRWLWLWGGAIVLMKTVNQCLALMKYGKCHFPHTYINKVTGFLLFLVVPMTFWSFLPITLVACVATLAAIHEGRFIMRTLDSDVRS